MADFPARPPLFKKYGSDEMDWDFIADWAKLIGVIVLVVIFLSIAIVGYNQRVSECESMGGTYMSGGKYGDPTCIKDGKIVIIWHFGQKTVNP